MPKHNPVENVMARAKAESDLRDALSRDLSEGDAEAAVRIVSGLYKFAQFDEQRTNVPGGEKLNVRRVVLTGNWEINPNAPEPKETEEP